MMPSRLLANIPALKAFAGKQGDMLYSRSFLGQNTPLEKHCADGLNYRGLYSYSIQEGALVDRRLLSSDISLGEMGFIGCGDECLRLACSGMISRTGSVRVKFAVR